MVNLQDPALVQAFMGYFLASEVTEVDKSEDSYAHAVTYAYRAAGCDYTGNRIHFVDTTTWPRRR